MRELLFSTPDAYLAIDLSDKSFITFAQGLTIAKEPKGLLAIWFDKIAFQERTVAIDSFEQKEKSIVITVGDSHFAFFYIDRARYEEIKAKNWLRSDLVKDLASDEEVQTYFSNLNPYS